MDYNPLEIEKKWQKYWDENLLFEPDNDFKKKQKVYFEYVSISKREDPYGAC